jgi:hypothetical protein
MAGSTRLIIYITVRFSLIWESYQRCQPYMIQKVKDGIRVHNIERYFRLDNPRDDNIAQVPITTSHQYKENLVLLMTLFEILKNSFGKEYAKILDKMFHEEL